MIIGFTGTSAGMSDNQMQQLGTKLVELNATEFHHGDCVGADAQAHNLARVMFLLIHIHPPTNDYRRAFCTGAHHIHTPKPYLDRNHDIVDACDVLIATPEQDEEILRSGTWATVRYARKLQKETHILKR
jgi:hypothetical protein